MRPATIATTVIFIVTTTPALAHSEPDINGQWSNYLDMGLGRSNDGKCVYRQFEERRYSISSMPPDAWTGLYSNVLHTRWVFTPRDNCSLPSIKQASIYIQTRSWTLDIRAIAPNRYGIMATYLNCWGLPCYSGVGHDSFTTVLDATDGELRDATEDAADVPQLSFYRRDATVARATAIAETFMKSWSRTLSKDNSAEDILALFDPLSVRNKDGSRAMVRNYIATRMDKSVKFAVLEAYLLESDVNQATTPLLLHFSVRHYQATGENFGETYELIQRDGKWRLLGFRF